MTPITKDTIQEAMAAAAEATNQDLRGMYPMACRTLATSVQCLRDNLAWTEAERDSLRAFARAVMAYWPEGTPDGGDLQELAEKHGLLKPERRRVPCGDGCSCAEYATSQEWASGVICYRRTALMMGPNV